MSRAIKPQPVDAIVVGAGATGGTAAKVLTEAGMSVVGLERGPWLTPEEHFSGDEIKYLNRGYLSPDAVLNPRTLREDEDAEAELFPFSPCPQMVGGGTVHWAGWFPRPMPSDFRQRSLHGDIDGASLADWPIDYDELEPYLSKVEWAFGCTGLDGANRHEPPRSRPYPTPPLPPTPFSLKFYEGCAKLGINGFPLPQAAISRPFRGRTPANNTGFWNQYGDPTTMRSTTLTSFVPEAVATGFFDLRADCYVQEVLLHADGRARGVRYLDPQGREVEQEASIVILCLGAIESTRLMLRSASNQFPEGLANSSGQLGRNATFHEVLFAVGMFDPERHAPLCGYAGNYITGGTFDFYETDESRGHIGGSLVGAMQVCQPINWIFPGRVPWGQAAKDADRDFYDHALALGIILHDMPVESNRVDLDPKVTDAWGAPVARITHKPHPNDVAMARWQVDKNVEILEAAGATTTVSEELRRSTGNTCHQHGTARMGDDPATSVLDPWCQAHDVPGLYVLDGSCFPTSTGVNPTLTMMANAWRCCDRIVAQGRPSSRRRASKEISGHGV
jgi:choline dehydrogenase-like flavoprotein